MMKVPADKGGPKGLNITLKPLSITQGNVEREKNIQENNRCGKELQYVRKNKKTTNNENFKFYTYYYKNNKQ